MSRRVKEHAFLSEGRPRACARHRQLFVPLVERESIRACRDDEATGCPVVERDPGELLEHNLRGT